MSDAIYAGIDGGGTNTRVVLVDGFGREIARTDAGTSNPAVIGHEQAGEVLEAALAAAMATLPEAPSIAAAWFGLSGCDRPADQRRLRPALERLAGDIRLTNDGELVLAGLPGSSGVALVAGTGSIAFGRRANGPRVRAGGWGAIMGDEGSGYALGCGLLRAFAAEIDGRGPGTSMTRRLRELWTLDDPYNAVPKVYSPPLSKGEIARLGQIVLEEADAGDEVASTLVGEAANDLALLATTVGKRLAFRDTLPLALTGSLLVHAEKFRELVLSRIEPDWPETIPVIVADPALTAARHLAATHTT